jgi:hypothetical protein
LLLRKKPISLAQLGLARLEALAEFLSLRVENLQIVESSREVIERAKDVVARSFPTRLGQMCFLGGITPGRVPTMFRSA